MCVTATFNLSSVATNNLPKVKGDEILFWSTARYSAEKLISFDSIINLLKCHSNKGILKICDITALLYYQNLTPRYS